MRAGLGLSPAGTGSRPGTPGLGRAGHPGAGQGRAGHGASGKAASCGVNEWQLQLGGEGAGKQQGRGRGQGHPGQLSPCSGSRAGLGEFSSGGAFPCGKEIAGHPDSISLSGMGTPGQVSGQPFILFLPSSPSRLPGDASSQFSQWMLSTPLICSHKQVF